MPQNFGAYRRPNNPPNNRKPEYNSYSQSYPQNFVPPPKPKKGSKAILFIIIILVFILITFSGIATAVLAFPESQFSKAIVNNTFLKNYIDLEETDFTIRDEDGSDKIINKLILGQEGNPDLFAFAQGGQAKTLVEVIEDALPSVFSVNVRSSEDNFGSGTELSAGTAYAVTKDGLLVTNKHVVNVICTTGVDQIKISALSYTEKVYDLELLSIDPIDDLAILKIKDLDEELKPVSLSNSDELKLGQQVVAIGNVLGELQNTVTTGIVSGINRSFETELEDPCTETQFQADGLIQTDAAINRGNSGGPLFNVAGQLIGMNTLGTVDAQNIGLAIPSSVIQTVLESYITNGQIIRARLGVTSLPIDTLVRDQNDWLPSDYGELLFTRQGDPVSQNSAARRAGLSEGDIILAVDGVDLIATSSNPTPLRREILFKQAGSTVELTVLKARNSSTSGFSYESEPQNVEITMGYILYDLETSELQAN